MICLSGFDFLDHVLFLLFCARLLAGHPKASGACSPGQGLLFAGEAKKLRFIVLFLGGTANPEGGEAEAEARSAASAQASFPARRAREKRGVEKEKWNEEKSKRDRRLPFRHLTEEQVPRVLGYDPHAGSRLPEGARRLFELRPGRSGAGPADSAAAPQKRAGAGLNDCHRRHHPPQLPGAD